MDQLEGVIQGTLEEEMGLPWTGDVSVFLRNGLRVGAEIYFEQFGWTDPKCADLFVLIFTRKWRNGRTGD